MWARRIAQQLRSLRRAHRLGQQQISDALGVSVSEISRLERGIRGLRLDQLPAWLGAMGYRVELVTWPDQGDSLDDEASEILAEVAASLPHLPPEARRALVAQMRVWRGQRATFSSEA